MCNHYWHYDAEKYDHLYPVQWHIYSCIYLCPASPKNYRLAAAPFRNWVRRPVNECWVCFVVSITAGQQAKEVEFWRIEYCYRELHASELSHPLVSSRHCHSWLHLSHTNHGHNDITNVELRRTTEEEQGVENHNKKSGKKQFVTYSCVLTWLWDTNERTDHSAHIRDW